MLSQAISAMPPCPRPTSSKLPIHTRKWLIVLVGLLVLCLLGACSKSDIPESSESSSPLPASAQSTIELIATTAYLEYSNKDVDPTTLVIASDSEAIVSTNDTIDLKTVGTQSVTYEVSLGDQTVEQVLEFIVRDTKGPTIEFSSDNPSIEHGGTYNPQDAISSVADDIDGDLGFVEAAPEARGKSAGTEAFYDQGWYTLEGFIDSSTPGTYPIKVTAADKHGNVTTKELSVTVKEPLVQEEAVPEVEPAAAPAEAPPAEPVAIAYTYIANTNTKKFHVPGCSSVRQMNESNKLEITATRDEMIASGYDPCGRCHP